MEIFLRGRGGRGGGHLQIQNMSTMNPLPEALVSTAKENLLLPKIELTQLSLIIFDASFSIDRTYYCCFWQVVLARFLKNLISKLNFLKIRANTTELIENLSACI